MPRLVFRPIDQWPDQPTRQRQRSRFDATVGATRELLERECKHLGAREVVVQIAVREGDIRVDGTYPKASAVASHPGVIVSFESKHGTLRYSTDLFTHWGDNLRAIALGLEALRKVDRYGIASGGEQYVGWNALPPGQPTAMGPGKTTLDEAARLLCPEQPEWMLTVHDEEAIRQEYRLQAKAHHPDHGGDPDTFRRLTEARDLLLGAAH